MRAKHLLVGVMVAALMVGHAEAASPSQPSYVVRLPPPGSYGSNDNVPGFLGMWFDPACNTLGTGAGCPRPASTDFPFPVTSTPAANSPGSSAGTPSYTQDGSDPSAPTAANPGTGARGWLAGVLAALGLQGDTATTGTASNGSLIALTKQVRNLLSAAATAANQLPGSATSATDATRLAVTQQDGQAFGGSMSAAGVIPCGTGPACNQSTGAIDTTGYGSVVLQVTNAGTSNTITYEQSNDNGTWYSLYGFFPNNGLGFLSATDTAVGMHYFAVTAKYLRARVSTYTSGTATIAGYLRAQPIPQLDPQTSSRAVNATEVPQATATYGTSMAATTVAAATLIPKASAGNFFGGYIANASAAGFLLIFNAATLPADGTVTPAHCLPVAANGLAGTNPTIAPEYFGTGISMAFSTGANCFTKTTTTGTAFMRADYK